MCATVSRFEDQECFGMLRKAKIAFPKFRLHLMSGARRVPFSDHPKLETLSLLHCNGSSEPDAAPPVVFYTRVCCCASDKPTPMQFSVCSWLWGDHWTWSAHDTSTCICTRVSRYESVAAWSRAFERCALSVTKRVWKQEREGADELCPQWCQKSIMRFVWKKDFPFFPTQRLEKLHCLTKWPNFVFNQQGRAKFKWPRKLFASVTADSYLQKVA